MACVAALKSTIPSSGTRIAAMPAACGSYSRICSGPRSCETFEAVGGAAFEKSVKAWNLFRLSGNHEFAADLVRNGVAFAELDHPPNPLHRQLCLLRTRLVIEPAMQNTAVITRLVTCRAGFLLDNENLNVRVAANNLVGGCEAYDSGTCDCDFHPASPSSNLRAELLVI